MCHDYGTKTPPKDPPMSKAEWLSWPSLTAAPQRLRALPRAHESLFPPKLCPWKRGFHFFPQISEKPWQTRNPCNEKSLWGYLHHWVERRSGWRLNEQNRTSTLKSVPCLASKTPGCLWSLLSRPRAHKFRNQRTAELTSSFVRRAAWGLERRRHLLRATCLGRVRLLSNALCHAQCHQPT